MWTVPQLPSRLMSRSCKGRGPLGLRLLLLLLLLLLVGLLLLRLQVEEP